MKYTKQALSFEKQAELLLSRGLIADKTELIAKLKSVNYYRLSGYFYPFKKQNSENYKDGTELTEIWNRYRFDRKLRFLVLDGIERIEVALKTDIAFEFSHHYGPFGYLYKQNLPLMKQDKYDMLIHSIEHETTRSKDLFVKHFFQKYGDEHTHLPLWMAVEIMSFGSVLSFIRGVPTPIKQKIASRYKVHDKVLESWLTSLNAVRNICAHHSRLWNRELGYKPVIPSKNKTWKTPFSIQNNRVFSVLSVIKFLIDIIIPASKWDERFKDLLEEFPEIPLKDMGFPQNWDEHEVWK